MTNYASSLIGNSWQNCLWFLFCFCFGFCFVFVFGFCFVFALGFCFVFLICFVLFCFVLNAVADSEAKSVLASFVNRSEAYRVDVEEYRFRGICVKKLASLHAAIAFRAGSTL